MIKLKEKYQHHKYRNPPLREVVFEAKFINDMFDNALPGQIYEKIRDDFPLKEDLRPTQFLIPINPNEFISQEAHNVRVPCMRAWNTQKTKCLQLGPRIIVANDIKYSSWEEFVPAIEKILKPYFELAIPQQLERIGIRFINRIVIPEESIPISNFFQIGLLLPDEMANSQIFDITLVTKSTKNFHVTSKVRFATDELKEGERGVAFILDIDAVISNEIQGDVENILRSADAIHDQIGRIFESFLRPETRELFGVIKT